MDAAGAFGLADHLVGAGFVKRQMRAAGEVRFGAADAGKPGRDPGGVHRFAGMRGASQGQFLVGDAGGLSGASLDHRQRLQGLERRAGVDRTIRRAPGRPDVARGIADGYGAPVNALDRIPADQLDENRVCHDAVGLPRVRGQSPNARRGFSKMANGASRVIFATEGASQTGPSWATHGCNRTGVNGLPPPPVPP